jgi:hypothetical protein
MRRGSQGKEIHRLEDGTLLGINLGADYCSEHEWGIERLRSDYGMNDAADGIARRQVTRVPADHILFDTINLKQTDYTSRKTSRSKWHGLLSFAYPLPVALGNDPKLSDDVVQRCELNPYGDDAITGAWDERSFGFLVKDESVTAEIYSAIQRHDLCIGLFNGASWNPFSRSGLGLLIASRIPQSVRDLWLESDRDGWRLKEAAAATGIAERLKKAGRNYFALSPKWMKEMSGKTKSKHPVIYWLNPYEQGENNYGWFTVEDLDAWIDGKGPIPKSRKKVASR